MSVLLACLIRLAFLTQPYGDEVTYTVNSRKFMVPVYISRTERDKIDHLVLYSSSDKGQTWCEVTKVFPDQHSFVFSAPRDGIYWFLVQIIDKDETKEPANFSKTKPNLKVAVATKSRTLWQSLREKKLQEKAAYLYLKVWYLKQSISELVKRRETKP
jgi:hypothetical protein